jgi:hypothetical protein
VPRLAAAPAVDGATPGRIPWWRRIEDLLTGRRVLVLAAIAAAATGGVIAGLSRVAAARR